jgi:radical SAM superfamily enzyme YgiQ (UPF0313 family)
MPLVRRKIHALKRGRHVPVVLGGVGYSIMPERILDFVGADYGVVAEGEVALPALLTCLEAGRPLDAVPNLVHRVGERIVRNPYFLLGGQAAVETKRGCNRQCIYCVAPLVLGDLMRPPRRAAGHRPSGS